MDEGGSQAEGGGDALPAEWVDEHADALYRFALRKLNDRHVIEDLLQETYLAAYKSRHLFRGDSTVRTWLIAILRLKIVDHFRAKSRQARGQEKVLNEPEAAFRELRLTAWNCDPTVTLENQEFWAVFQDCVDKLPATLSRVFLMREMDGCTTEMVCSLLGISSENVAVRAYRARSAMRDCLDKNWFTKD